MMRSIWVLLGVLLIVGSASGQVLFSDDFSHERVEWRLDMPLEVYDGSIINDVLGYSLNAVLEAGEDWTDIEIQFRITVDAWGPNGAFRILIRHQSLWHSYWVSLVPSGVMAHRFTGSWESGTNLGSSTTDPSIGQVGSHTFRLIAKGFEFTTWVDEKLVLHFTDPEEAFEIGGIAFRIDDVAGSIDEIVVIEL